MEPLAPPALEDGGRDAESDAEEGSPRASAKVRAAAALFDEVD